MGAQDFVEGQAKTFVSLAQVSGSSGISLARGARHFYFTNHTLTGHIFLRLSNGIVVRLTADKSPSYRCVLTGKMFHAATCSLSRPIPTLIAMNCFALHCANHMDMKCLGLPRTALAWCRSRTAKLTVGRASCLGERTYWELCWAQNTACEPGWKKRHSSGDSLSGCSRVSITSGNWGVAVTVAVHSSTSATFQAFTSDYE
jgi:hypothetical protein